MRWIMRFVAALCLCVAVAAAVIDAALSVINSRFIYTPMSNMLKSLFGGKLPVWPIDLTNDDASIMWERVSTALLQLPLWLLFGIVALLFYVASYRRRARL